MMLYSLPMQYKGRQQLNRLLEKLEQTPPFDDEAYRYTLNPAFADGKCGDYSVMLCYVLNKLGYDVVKHYAVGQEAHQYVICQIEGEYIIIDWTQSQYFGEKHFWGTFDELAKTISKEIPDIKTQEERITIIRRYYGIDSESDLEQIFNRKATKQKEKWASRKNLLATRWMYISQTDNMNELSEPEQDGVFDFNQDVLPQLQDFKRQPFSEKSQSPSESQGLSTA